MTRYRGLILPVVVLTGCTSAISQSADAPSGAGRSAAGQSREAEVLRTINFARTEPAKFADWLREYRRGFNGTIVTMPDSDQDYQTFEGAPAVDEAIHFLDIQRPLPPLESDTVLALAARDWTRTQGPAGGLGHVGPGGSNPGTRVAARGGDKYVAETISYGFDDPLLVVTQLIVDDGVPGRGHRKTAFGSGYAFAGAACGPHAAYRIMCVVDYSRYPAGRPVPPAGSGN